MSVLNFVAHYQARLQGERFKPVALENKLLAEKYSEAWGVLRSWPEAFHKLLDGYKNDPMAKKGIGGVNKHFRDLSEALYRQKENKGIQLLKTEFDRYLQKSWPGHINSDKTKRIRIESTTRDIITRNAAASLLNCRPVLIDKYVKQKKLTIKEFKDRKHYSRFEVLELANLIVSNWTMTQASKELCLSPYQLRQLLDAGVIPMIQRPDKLNRDWIIDKSKCREFIFELLDKAQTQMPEGSVSLSGIQRNGFSIVRLVESMRDGSVLYRVQVDKKNECSFKQFVEFCAGD